jgi:PadR family transcriptional regulator PadR
MRNMRGSRMGMGRPWIELYLLLLIAEKPAHGYELSTRLEEFEVPIFSVGQMGNLYRVLSNIEEMGLITSEWDTEEAGPARKIYRITTPGLEYLKNAEMRIRRFRDNIDGFLKRIEQLKEV